MRYTTAFSLALFFLFSSPVRGAALPGAHAAAKKGDWPREHILRAARNAWECGRAAGELERSILTVIDYSLPSTERRLWVLDLDAGEVLFHEYVAHGRNSGQNRAVSFSNTVGSKQSSIGLFRTAHTYRGRHGHSLRLEGLEQGFNDRAYERAIVMHGADYVSTEFIARHHRLGRSWGCPALRPEIHFDLIEAIKGGTALFAYYPDRRWLEESAFLSCERDERPELVRR